MIALSKEEIALMIHTIETYWATGSCNKEGTGALLIALKQKLIKYAQASPQTEVKDVSEVGETKPVEEK